MKFELPTFRRCCLCIPLRYGLIVWAYVKLIPSLVLTIIYGMTMEMSSRDDIVIVIVLALCVDMAFNISLLAAAHKKNVKLLTIYYYYSIVETVVFVLLVLLNTYFVLLYTISCNTQSELCTFRNAMRTFELLGFLGVNVFNFVLQCYLIMLVNSEIVKLRSNHVLQFVNIRATIEPQELKIEVAEKTENK